MSDDPRADLALQKQVQTLGIPAIRLGSGGDGGRAHSLDEWIDVEIEESLRGLNAGLATILGTVGVATDAA